jgi:hypothetical protein
MHILLPLPSPSPSPTYTLTQIRIHTSTHLFTNTHIYTDTNTPTHIHVCAGMLDMARGRNLVAGDCLTLMFVYSPLMLLVYKSMGNTNYVGEMRRAITRYKAMDSPALILALAFSSVINTCGVLGGCISVDLHMEHLNKFAEGIRKILVVVVVVVVEVVVVVVVV